MLQFQFAGLYTCKAANTVNPALDLTKYSYDSYSDSTDHLSSDYTEDHTDDFFKIIEGDVVKSSLHRGSNRWTIASKTIHIIIGMLLHKTPKKT